MSKVNEVLYELGFLDKNGNPEKDKDRRWKVGLNQAELIIKDALRDVRRIEDFVLSREEFQRHWLRVKNDGEQYANGYDDALRDIRNYIKSL
jgi:hypothetical protein